MFKRVAMLIAAVVVLLPATTRASGEGDATSSIAGPRGTTGVYYPPESPSRPDLDLAPNEMLNRNVRILRTTNKAQLNRYVPVAYETKNVNPYAVVRFIRTAVRSEDGALFTFVSPDGDSGRVMVMIPEYQIPAMDQLMKQIDRKDLTSSDGSKRAYVQLKHRRANISSNDPVLNDPDFIGSFGLYLTGNGSEVIVDPEQNAVFIEDAPSGTEWMLAAIESKLDVPTAQVQVKANVYELSTSNNTRLGTDYQAWRNGPGKPLFAVGAFAERGRVSVRDGAAKLVSNNASIGEAQLLPKEGFSNSGHNYAFRFEHHSAFFDFLSTKGAAELLTSAKLAILNTRTATITSQDQILYYAERSDAPDGGVRSSPFSGNVTRSLVPTGNELQTTTEEVLSFFDSDDNVLFSFGITSEELVPVETGLDLTITPLIYENGADFDVDIEISDYNGFDDSGFPQINTREHSTAVRMGEGQEIVIGGINRTEHTDATQKPPFLGSIPLIGYLVAQENDRHQDTSVAITLELEKIVRNFTDDYESSNEAEQSILDQADGTTPVDIPEADLGWSPSP